MKGMFKMNQLNKYSHRNIDEKTQNKINQLKWPYNLAIEMAMHESECVVSTDDIIHAVTKITSGDVTGLTEKAIVRYLECDMIKLSDICRDVLRDRYISQMTYKEIGEKHNRASAHQWGRATVYRAFNTLINLDVKHFAHFEMLYFMNGENDIKYQVMCEYGRMPYYSDIENFFPRALPRPRRIGWEECNLKPLVQAVGKKGIAYVLEKTFNENETLKAENERLKNVINEERTAAFTLNTLPLIPIEETTLPRKICNRLRRKNIDTCRDLGLRIIDGSIEHIEWLGPQSISVIKTFIKETFDVDYDQWRMNHE